MKARLVRAVACKKPDGWGDSFECANEQGTPGWLADRMRGIGASELADAIGLGYSMTPQVFVRRWSLRYETAESLPREEDRDTGVSKWLHRAQAYWPRLKDRLTYACSETTKVGCMRQREYFHLKDAPQPILVELRWARILPDANSPWAADVREEQARDTRVLPVVDEPIEGEAVEHGHRWEPAIRQAYEKAEGVRVHELNLLVNNKIPGLQASLDGYIWRTCAVEIKAPFNKPYYSHRNNHHCIPKYYLVQMMAQMVCAGVPYAVFLVGDMHEPWYKRRRRITQQIVPFDPGFWAWIEARLRHVWACMANGRLPQIAHAAPGAGSLDAWFAPLSIKRRRERETHGTTVKVDGSFTTEFEGTLYDCLRLDAVVRDGVPCTAPDHVAEAERGEDVSMGGFSASTLFPLEIDGLQPFPKEYVDP